MSNEVKPDPTPFASMARNEANLLQLHNALKRVIIHSFNQEVQRGEKNILCDIEIKRRTEICLKWFKIMRADLGWAVERIIDFLPQALRCELDGVEWSPSKHSAWAPEILARG